jgi:hypothetical protein
LDMYLFLFIVWRTRRNCKIVSSINPQWWFLLTTMVKTFFPSYFYWKKSLFINVQ